MAITYRFAINNVSYLSYIAHGGFKWSRNDIEAPDAGRTLDGRMHRGRVATKVRLDITCRPLTSAELSSILGALQPEYVSVRYYDPLEGIVTKSMYSNNIPATCDIVYDDGSQLWTGFTFPLVEV